MKLHVPSVAPFRCLVVAALVMGAGVASPSYAFELAQKPLYIGANVKPNFMMALDDSVSMYLERAFPGGDPEGLTWNIDNKSMFKTGQPGVLHQDGPYVVELDVLFEKMSFKPEVAPPVDQLGFARSPDFNAAYFHPAVTYLPWQKANGSRWPNANVTSVPMDPRVGANFAPENAQKFNLTDVDGYPSTTEYVLFPGMTLPAGMSIATHSKPYLDPQTQTQKFRSGCGDAVPATNLAWKKLAQSVVVAWQDMNNDGSITAAENWCTLKLRYFPATFYLKQKASLPPGYGYVAQPKEIVAAFGPGGGSLWRYEIRPQNFATAAQYDAAIQNFGNWFQYHRNRFLSLIASSTEALSDIDDVRMGMFPINDRKQVEMADMSIAVQRSAIYDRLTAFHATAKLTNNASLGGTPNRDAVAHIGEQFRRTDPAAPVQKACQVNAAMLFTDGYTSTYSGPKTYGNTDGALAPPMKDAYANTLADIVTSYYSGAKTPLRGGADFPAGQVPVSKSCESDPQPWMDCQKNLHLKFYGITFGPSGLIYGVNPNATADPYKFPPNWNASGDPDAVGGPAAVDEIWHATLNGRGKFVNAKTPSDIAIAIKAAIAESITSASTAGGVGASGTRRGAGFLGYVPHYSAEDWTGDLTAHSVSAEGAFDSEVWSAAQRLEAVAPSQRKLYFSDAGQTLKPFTLAGFGGQNAAVARLGLPSTTPYGRTVTEVIDYLRGDHTFEKKLGVGSLRNRSSRLGDIFGSQPEVLSSAGFGYAGLPESQGGGTVGAASYGKFLQTTKKMRRPVAFVGANDGMLHAFDAGADADGGKELFAIAPDAVLKHMGKLPSAGYEHRYFVDGSPVQGDAWDGAWKTIVLVPLGAGGKSIMALDATDPAANFGAEHLMWEFTDPDLHETISKPAIVALEGGKWVAIFGSGIDPVDGAASRAHLFVVDLFSGALLDKIAINPPANLAQKPNNGIVAFAAVDSDYNLKADTIYVADYDAFLWRLDVSPEGKVAPGNEGKHLFRALDRDGQPLAVTGGLDVFPHHIRGQMVFFGSGRYLSATEDQPPSATSTQAFFGFWDDPEKPGSYERASLQVQDILGQSNVSGTEARTLTDHPVNWATHRGWLVDLKLKDKPNALAELSIGQPTVALGRVTFTTFTPAGGDPCGGGGVNRLYSLSASNGVGELSLPGDNGQFGAIDVAAASAGGPVLSPTIVTSPPELACIPGDAGCPLPEPDDEGNVLAAPSPGCRTPLGILLGDGLLDFASLTCGRQSWQQLQ